MGDLRDSLCSKGLSTSRITAKQPNKAFPFTGDDVVEHLSLGAVLLHQGVYELLLFICDD